MNAKSLLVAISLAVLATTAYAGDKPKFTEEQKQAIGKECRAAAKEQDVAKDDRKQFLKECRKTKFKALLAEMKNK